MIKITREQFSKALLNPGLDVTWEKWGEGPARLKLWSYYGEVVIRLTVAEDGSEVIEAKAWLAE